MEGKDLTMTPIDPESVYAALRKSLHDLMPSEFNESRPIDLDQNLLDRIDSFEFEQLILNLEASLEVDLPLDQIDLRSIAHIDRLIAFICTHG